MSDGDLFDEIHELASAHAEGRLTEEQAARLEWLVVDSPNARRLYAQYALESASLRWWAGGAGAAGGEGVDSSTDHSAQESPKSSMKLAPRKPTRETLQDSLQETMILPALTPHEVADDAPPGPIMPPAPKPSNRARNLRRWGLGLAAALALLIGSLVLLRPPKPIVATLESSIKAQWDIGSVPTGRGPMKAGEYSLRSGGARLVLVGGAEVIVKGPVRFTLESPHEMRLLNGQLTAQVAHGTDFTVHTQSATVMDLGTEFGVAVNSAGTAEVQVIRGRVQVQPSSGTTATKVAAGSAVAVAPGSAVAAPVPFKPDQFAHELALIDLADVVAGGDGSQHGRSGGINPVDGSAVADVPSDPQEQGEKFSINGDGQFHPCPERPLIAGVFIPRGGPQPVVLDAQGHTFTGFANPDGTTYYWLWAGGSIPGHTNTQLASFPTLIGLVDYNSPGHSVLFMHASKGITFNLDAIRAANPRAAFTRFRAVCTNTSVQGQAVDAMLMSPKTEFWVFVDGQQRFSKSPLLRTDPPFDISVQIGPAARSLTLVSTDGGDTTGFDWVTLGDPRLE